MKKIFLVISFLLVFAFSSRSALADFASSVTSLCASATDRKITVSSVETVSANLTVCSNLTVAFTGSGQLSVNTGVTVTINGPMEAPLKQIFSGAGSIVFGQGNADAYIEHFGLKTTNTAATNDTAISKAIASMPTVGGGTIRINGWNYKISASITIQKNMLRLIGPHDVSAFIDDLATPDPVFLWDGAANGVMMKLAPRGTGVGIVEGLIKGISIDGGATNGQANIVGMELGDVTGPTFDGSAWQYQVIEGVAIMRTFKGMRIGRADVFTFNRLIIKNNNPITVGSIGIEATPTWTGPIIKGHFTGGVVAGFERLVQIGNITSGTPAGVYFDHMTMENYSAFGLDIRRCDHCVISNSNFEGGGAPIQPILKVGDDALSTTAKNLVFSNNRVVLGAGAPGSIRLERFEGMTIGPGNDFNGNNTSVSYVFWNNSGASARNGGQFFGNTVDGTVQALFDPGHGRTGFNFIQESLPGLGLAVYREMTSHKRLNANLGLNLVAGDFALSAGWGTTATISAIGGAGTSTDARGKFTINSSGTGQAANPTVTITFKDLAWVTTPVAFVGRNGGNQPSVLPTWAESATTLVITFPGTPVAGESYTFQYIVIG